MHPENKTHHSLEKALKLLLSFIPYNEEKGTLELSQLLGIHRSTVSRLLGVLESSGFLQQSPQTKKFSLGPSIGELGWTLNESLHSQLIRVAIPHVDQLRNSLGETVALEVASRLSTIIAYSAEGPGPVRVKGTIGGRHWYHAAAGAKAILAYSSPEFQDEVLRKKLTPCTPNTITDRKSFEKELRLIKRRGFSFDNEERNIGIRAFGCALFNREGKPVAGIAVAGPLQQITWEERFRIIPPLKEAAARISEQLGYREPAKRKGRVEMVMKRKRSEIR